MGCRSSSFLGDSESIDFCLSFSICKKKRLIVATLMIEKEMEKNGVQTPIDTDKKRDSGN